jgi:DNA primase
LTVADDIKAKIDIVAYVGETVPLKKAGRNFSAPCPFHNERTPSFFVFPDRQTWRCFGACATGGDVFAFVMRRGGIGFGEALRQLADRAGVRLADPQASSTQARLADRLKDLNRAAAMYFHEALLHSPEAAGARKHLADRGVNDETIEEFRLGYCPADRAIVEKQLTGQGFTPQELDMAGLLRRRDDGSTYSIFRGRLMIPIQDERSDYAGFGARALDDSKPKYINSPQSVIFEKGSVLYAIHRARDSIRDTGYGVIVEGYMDALAAHQHGYRNVVASMGTALTERQVSSLTRLASKFVLALDPDAAGDEATLRSLESSWRILERPRSAPQASLTAPETRPAPELFVMALPRGKDPDEIIREDKAAWEQYLATATPVVDWVFQAVVSRLDAATVQGKTAITRRLAPLVHQAESVFEQNARIAKLAKLLGEEENIIRQAVGGLRGPRVNRGRGASSLQALNPGISQPLRDTTEEVCLATLLRYPELLPRSAGLEADDFSKAQNREIFKALAGGVAAEALKDQLDESLSTALDALFSMRLVQAPPHAREQELRDYMKRLRRLRLDMELEALQAQMASGELPHAEASARAEILQAERCRIDGVQPAQPTQPVTGS